MRMHMPRFSRVVIAGLPHHVTQRGNRRQRTFFEDEDYALYLKLMSQSCRTFGVSIWAYCLMPNHAHLIAVPNTETALTRAIAQGHEAYTRYINFKKGWQGYLWQGRFRSFPMDEGHLLRCARYIELNPVFAKLAPRPDVYPWSSARAHLVHEEDPFVDATPLLMRVPDWGSFLEDRVATYEVKLIKRHERSGRPLGSSKFVRELERQTGRILMPGKPGRKARVG